jgi:curved DNA-binding protein CbpA
MSSDKDRRRFKRYKRKSEFRLSIGGTSFPAHTVDFSIGGIGFSVEGTPPLSEGAIIDLKIEDHNMDIKGKVAWLQKSDTYLRVGIEKLSISGLLRDCQMSDILLDLKKSNKTGIFEIIKGPIHKKIHIKNGDMVFATSNEDEDRLGEFLLRVGKISLEQYSQSVNILKKTGKRQGTILVELGFLKPTDLVWAVQNQVEEIILSLFQWEDGEFLFIEGQLPTKEVITLKISTANIIYQGIKRINSFTRIKNALPPLDTVLYYSPDPINLFQDINLDKDDKDISSMIDGKSSIEKILSISPLDNFKTMKILYALLSTRIIEVMEEGAIEDKIHEKILKDQETEMDLVFIERVENLYKKIESINYYDIFEVERQAAHDMIKKAYYKSAKEFHPDRHFTLPSIDLKNKLNTIFSKITEAYRTLSDLRMRSDYDQRLSNGTARIEKSNVEIAKNKFSEGLEAFKRQSYSDAVEFFGQASYLDSSNSNYYFHMGIALEKEKRYREAEKAYRQALKIDPFNADYLAELGLIYLKLDLPLRAKSSFETALKYNPSSKKAAQGLQSCSPE